MVGYLVLALFVVVGLVPAAGHIAVVVSFNRGLPDEAMARLTALFPPSPTGR